MPSRTRVSRPVPNFQYENGRSPIPEVPCCKGFTDETKGFLALTFDDGPKPEVTEPLLEYLLENDIWASFFLIGEHAIEHKSTVTALHEAGMVIGNHTWRREHQPLTSYSPNEVREDVRRAHGEISNIIGEAVRVFRAPCDEIRDNTFSAVTLFETLMDLGYSHHCSYYPAMKDHEDGRTASELIHELRTGMNKVPLRDGYVNFDRHWLLAHDGHGTFERMHLILDWIRSQVNPLCLRFTGVISSV